MHSKDAKCKEDHRWYKSPATTRFKLWLSRPSRPPRPKRFESATHPGCYSHPHYSLRTILQYKIFTIKNVEVLCYYSLCVLRKLPLASSTTKIQSLLTIPPRASFMYTGVDTRPLMGIVYLLICKRCLECVVQTIVVSIVLR